MISNWSLEMPYGYIIKYVQGKTQVFCHAATWNFLEASNSFLLYKIKESTF